MRTKSILAALALCLCCCVAGLAQNKKFTYKFYGQIRGDLFYNSRANGEIVDGLFHLYPMDHDYDPDGKDLNARMDGNFYVLYSRLGVDMTGPMLGKIRTSAKAVGIAYRADVASALWRRVAPDAEPLDRGAVQCLQPQSAGALSVYERTADADRRGRLAIAIPDDGTEREEQ